MNYDIQLTGSSYEQYDNCIKLLIHSAMESDYIVDVYSSKLLTPVSAKVNRVLLRSSAKQPFQKIIVDFDSIVSTDEKVIVLAPDILVIPISSKCTHYWGILGSIFKLMSDISPAYVTGYLLEYGMKDELDLFSKFSLQLPFALQVAINELVTDKL